MNKKALIAMSGGVDSSVAAAIMVQNGYECIGVTMRLHDDGGNNDGDISNEHSCCSLSDVEDAKAVSYSLGMNHYVFNFKDGFKQNVIDKFVSVYENGGTPNPCIDCNRFMKFSKLYKRAEMLGCDTIVTGHYAVIEYDGAKDRYLLKKAVNSEKDQSYVLYFLTQEQLKHTKFPLGEFDNKESVRKIAEKYGFSNAGKPDSQDICFVPDNDYASFIERYTGKTYPEGNFVDENGKILGVHKGIIRYTIGQRKGLGLALPAPMYVCKKDIKSNEVTLTTGCGLYSKEMTVTDFNWIYERPEKSIRVSVRTRYHTRETEATAYVISEDAVRVVFDEPRKAAAKGQAAVLYDGDYVVGGGTISETTAE